MIFDDFFLLKNSLRELSCLFNSESDVFIGTREDLDNHTILCFSDFVGRELIAQGSQNVWICHVGDAEGYGSFDYFAGTIMNSEVQVSMSHTDR